jgi:hypothetical protein
LENAGFFNREQYSMEQLKNEVDAWQSVCNAAEAQVNWQFIAEDARIKLKKLYPSIQV